MDVNYVAEQAKPVKSTEAYEKPAAKPETQPGAKEVRQEFAPETRQFPQEAKQPVSQEAKPELKQQALLVETLKHSGLKPTPENLQLLAKMQDSGVPITAENITGFYKAAKMTGDIRGAVFLLQNQLPVTTKNLALVKNLTEGSAKITQQLETLIDAVKQLPEPLKGQVSKLLGQPQSLPGQPQPLPTQPLPLPGQPQAAQTPQPLPLPGQPQPTQPQPLPGQSQPLPGQPQPLPGQPVGYAPQGVPGSTTAQPQPLPGQPPAAQPQTTHPSTAQPQPLPGQPQPLPAQPQTQTAQPLPGQPPAAQTSPGQPATAQPLPAQPPAAQPQSTQPQPLPAQPLPGQPVGYAPQGVPGSTTGQPQAAQPAPILPEQSLPTLPQPAQPSPAFPQPQLPTSSPLLFPIENSSTAELENYLNNLKNTLAAAAQILQAAGSPAAGRVLQALDTLREYIDFSAGLRNQFFMQLPVVIDGQVFNTAMFVNKDNKKKSGGSAGKQTASALIALDTAFVGHFETYVQKKDTGVHCQFRLDNENIELLVRQNIHRLDRLLRDHGYSLDSFTFMTGKEPFTLLDSVEESFAAAKPDTVFDARA